MMRPDEVLSVLRPHGATENNWQVELVLEFIYWGVVALLTLVLLIFRPGIFRRVEGYFLRISRNSAQALGFVVFSALALRLALLPVLPIPEPIANDECSYLLQAKTFAMGRVTNPTPAMWVHFETFHVNMWPTYQSMYPPANAMFLAPAYVLHVHPWWGVWLSIGLMCGAVCWMLQGWMPLPWAFLGGMFCVLRFATFSYWMNSYWGGAAAAIGGALVFGALPRIKHSEKVRYPLIFVLGLALLANSRPYEGLVVSIPAVIALAVWLFGFRRRRPLQLAAFAPAIALAAAVAAGMAYYNWRSTGNPLDMPYAENQRQYHISKPFIWQGRYPIPAYHHQVMRTMYVMHELPDYLSRKYPDALLNMLELKVRVYYDFFVWPLFIVLAFSFRTMLRSRHVRLLGLTLLLFLAGLLVEQWPPHAQYAAPGLCVVVATVLFSLRLFRTLQVRGIPLGPMFVRAAVLCAGLWMAVPLVAAALNPFSVGLYSVMPPPLDRARLETQLEQQPGPQLLFVRTRRSNRGMFDWVYNQPDIPNAKVIWARDMGPQANQELIHAYPGRQMWIVDQDDGIMRLTPYGQQDQDLDPARILHVAANQPVASNR